MWNASHGFPTGEIRKYQRIWRSTLICDSDGRENPLLLKGRTGILKLPIIIRHRRGHLRETELRNNEGVARNSGK